MRFDAGKPLRRLLAVVRRALKAVRRRGEEKMNNHRVAIHIDKGAFSAGDASLVPPGYCLVCRNMLVRPNRLDSRPPMVYDSLMSVRGLLNYDDQSNKKSRLVALNATPNLFMKGTSGEAWSASLGTPSGTRLTDFTNYRGKAYYAMDNGSGTPSAINSFDGVNLSSTPFNSPISGRCVTAFLDRVFVASPRVTVAPAHDIENCYRFDDTSRWTASNVSGRGITLGSGGTVYRAYPTNASNFLNGIDSPGIAMVQIPGSGDEQPYVWRQDYRAVSDTATCTFRMKVLYAFGDVIRFAAVPYDVGDTFVDNDIIYRCVTAGTTANPLAALSTTLGSLTTDGTCVWLAERSRVLVEHTVTVPTATDNREWQSVYVPFLMPWRNGTVGVIPSFEFDDLVPVDLAYKDGLGDGDQRKRNYGAQVTAGDFHFPFVNTETATSAAVDLDEVIWSEVLDVKRFIASQTYRLPEVPGFPTAATTLAGRYLVHKRNGFWVFNGNQDLRTADVIPIRRERIYSGVGCIGPKAHDKLNDVHYFIGEDDVYSFTVGADEPVGVCGEGMREEIMDRGSNWVESQAAFNMPLLRIDQRQKEVWVYTQKGKLYCYNIERKAWSSHDINGNKEIADLMFNANTRKMYVAIGGFGLSRLDWSSSPAKDTIDNTATLYDVTCDIVARPLEMYPDRVDAVVDNLGVYHLATAAQTGQRHIASVSFDRGETFPWTNEVLIDITDPRNEIPLYESAPSVTLKLSSIGKTGPTIWAVSKLDAEVIVLGGEWPAVKPQSVSENL